MSKLSMNLGFIGAGIMAQATAKALISSDLINPGSIYASAPSDNNLKWWKDAGANTTHDNGTILKKCKVIVLAMKPQYFEKALSTADKDFIQENETVFISLLAGINTSQLQKILNKHLNFKSTINEEINVYHVIPNTAISIGYGCTGELKTCLNLFVIINL
uniref:Pyrroline-5-carboxylate reductase catalytic N-terminal domain-containing protein n=1 Tax=Clastoptera arizonana TaxID=38151 RepID=A0A1B6D3N1_9HEMI